MSELFNMLMRGEFVEAIISSYTNVMGIWFWLALYGLGFFMIYYKTKDFAGTTLFGMVIVPILLPLLPPESHLFIYVMLALGATGILYRVFH
jgi:hypothetical protein